MEPLVEARAARHCRELPLVAPFNRTRDLKTQTHRLNITDRNRWVDGGHNAVHLNSPPEVLNTNSTSSLALLLKMLFISATPAASVGS